MQPHARLRRIKLILINQVIDFSLSLGLVALGFSQAKVGWSVFSLSRAGFSDTVFVAWIYTSCAEQLKVSARIFVAPRRKVNPGRTTLKYHGQSARCFSAILKISHSGITLSRESEMTQLENRILCADSNWDDRALVGVHLEMANYEVVLADTVAAGLRWAVSGHFDLYLIEMRFADGSGLDLVREVRAFDAETPIVIYSASADASEVALALEAGAQAYLTKPSEPALVIEIIALHITAARASKRNGSDLKQLFDRCEDILLRSALAQRKSSELSRHCSYLMEQNRWIVEQARKLVTPRSEERQ
jgi:DNA-binding response OmpR family regulator